MSLRDQLLKAGLTNKKKVQSTNRALKKKRRKKQSQKDADNVIREREQDQKAAHRKAEVEKQAHIRQQQHEAREDHEHLRRVQNLLRQHQIQIRPGTQALWHRAADGRTTHRLDVSRDTAKALSGGKLAVAWMGQNPQEPKYILLPAETARRIQDHEPQRVLWLVDGPAVDTPEESMLHHSAAPDVDDIDAWLDRKARLAKLLSEQ